MDGWTALQAPVVEVVVLEDRAQVRREGRVLLPAGRSRLVVAEVAPVLADRTLQARVVAGEGALVDARVERAARLRREEKPAELRARQDQQRALRAERETLAAKLARREQDLARLQQVQAQVLAELAQDVAWGRGGAEAWPAAVAAVRARVDALAEERLDLEEAISALDRRLGDLGRLVSTLDEPAARLRADLHLLVQAEAATTLTLSLTYVVPGACWRPLHRATLRGEEVLVETFGCVWQRTGEDWTGASVLLSTQRAAAGAEPPLLGEDLLLARPRQEQVVVQARDQALQTTGLGQDRVEGTLLPGIDDGGEVRALRVEGRPPLPSDGRPHRLPLSRFTAPAEQALVALPERAAAALRRVRAVHPGPGPLLAGPVELVAEGGRVGRTSLLYVAPGERFELGFGPDPGLRLHRRAERVDQEPGALSRWAATDHRVTLRLSNLGTAPRTVELTERIPVSEVEQVRVELDPKASSAGAKADADGMVRWTVALAPGDTALRVLAWRVERKRDVAGL